MNKKVTTNPSDSPFPSPLLLVTANLKGSEPNIITVALAGILSANPPTAYIAVHPDRYSNQLLKESMEYVINIPSQSIVRTADACGVVSGRDVNKFKTLGLTPISASYVNPPLIDECPVNIECKVKEIINYGSHDIFVGEILMTHCNEDVLNANGRPDVNKIDPYAFILGEYRKIGKSIGFYGFSSKK